MSSDSEDCTAVGKLFHTRASVELNAWPPVVTCSVRGTSSMADDDERRRYRFSVTNVARVVELRGDRRMGMIGNLDIDHKRVKLLFPFFLFPLLAAKRPIP